ncbi:MAG TPA: hypothetical protein VK943_11175, partial [Arenibaculum sp.]|nr:hypothetical protein [Arenibaculum sp.]
EQAHAAPIAPIRAEAERPGQPCKPARPERTMTNHDVRAGSAVPARGPDPLGAALAGLTRPHGPGSPIYDAPLPCLDIVAGSGPALAMAELSRR